jgi:hypothetical protein
MKIDYSQVLDKIKFWKQSIENVKDFTGTSPPAVFVGKAFYPQVFVGILTPPQHQANAEILDFPEKWYEQKASIEDILNYRGQLIYSRFKTSSIKRPSGKLTEVTQELAMSEKPADVEIQLKKQPKFSFNLNPWTTPIGNPAPIIQAKLTENPSVDRKVEYLVSDYDVKAQDAVNELYKHNIPVSKIEKIFSVGLLGVTIQRKFVPTRWSWTAVQDIIGKNLMEKIKTYPEVDEVLLFSNEYLANHFEILLIPDHYQYEFIEVWDTDKINPSIDSDYEPYWGRKIYASTTAGGFYSARLGVIEGLDKLKRQATVLIVREIRPQYWAPVGVWEIRETVRDAFNKPSEKFDSVEEAVKRICGKLITKDKWVVKSKLLRILKEQKKILQFSKFKN